MTQPNISMHGVVDLGALAPRTAPTSAEGGAAPAGTSVVIDVTETTFQAEVLERSLTVPVVIDFWADWCQPCKTLSPVLERLAAADGGKWVLAKIDVDAEQRLGAAFQVQSIPSVFAVLKGQPVPLFQGALPEAEARRYLDELLKVAAANGVNGSVSTDSGAEEAGGGADFLDGGPPLDPGVEAALDALDRGDLDGAAAAYRSVLDRAPADPAAKAGLAQVELVRRARALDQRAVRRAARDPADVAAACDAADLDLLDGRVEEAFGRLVEAVRRTSGAERDTARRHLVELFEVVGSEDPRVPPARVALANALF